MKYKISEAAKQIKLLNYEKDNLLQKEAMNSTLRQLLKILRNFVLSIVMTIQEGLLKI